jgi:hypothetical protein
VAKDWFDDYGDPERKAAIVKRELARIGLSLDDKATKLQAPAAVDRPTRNLFDTSARDGFFDAGGDVVISPILADQLHWTPPLHNSDLPEGGKNEVADADGYEGMRHD